MADKPETTEQPKWTVQVQTDTGKLEPYDPAKHDLKPHRN